MNMGKILRISDRLAKKTEHELYGEIIAPSCISQKEDLIEIMQKRIENLRSAEDGDDDNFARLGTEQEIIFLQKIAERLEHE
jgi:hypothetical protein